MYYYSLIMIKNLSYIVLLSYFSMYYSWAVQYGSTQNRISSFSHPIITSIYIPLWFFSNILLFSNIIEPFILYIPLWFFSNNFSSSLASSPTCFTFHFGSSQTIYKTLTVNYAVISIPLWFFSN